MYTFVQHHDVLLRMNLWLGFLFYVDEVKYIGEQTLIYMCIVVYYMSSILYLIKYAKLYF